MHPFGSPTSQSSKTIVTNDHIYAKKIISGRVFLKYGRKGKPHYRFISVSPDLSIVRWDRIKEAASKPPRNGKHCLSSTILNVAAGRQTEVFINQKSTKRHRKTKKRNNSTDSVSSQGSISYSSSRSAEKVEIKSPHSQPDDCSIDTATSNSEFPRSLSVVFESRTLDIDAETEDERDEWFALFSWLKSKAGAVGSPYNVKHKTHVDLDLNWSGENLEEQFTIGRLLGAGTFGRVYSAKHAISGYNIAIKMVMIDDVERTDAIRREVDILKKCRHKNIVSYFGCWGPSNDHNLWILMERCKYGSVIDVLELCHKKLEEDKKRAESIITAESTITVDDASGCLLDEAKSPTKGTNHRNSRLSIASSADNVRGERSPSPPPFKHDIRKPLNFLTENHIAYIMLQTLEALTYLHEQQNVVHRDVKGRNILVNEYGLIKLSDFGISKEMLKDSKRNSNRGTAHWMSPELVRDETPTYVSDIWSLGITAIELAEGAPPRADLSTFQAMTETAHGPAPSLSIPKLWSTAFIHFVKRCLIKDPERRPQASELLEHPFVSRLGNVKSLFENLNEIALAHVEPVPHTAEKYEDDYPEIFPDTYSGRSFQKVEHQSDDSDVRQFRHSKYPLLPPFKKRRRGFTCCTIL